MTTRFLLIRHASCVRMGEVLAGRRLEAPLSPVGQREARALAAAMSQAHDVILQTSPRQRTLCTAAAIAAATGVSPTTEPALDEVDFGEWTGRTFLELEADPRWRLWNESRATQRAPGGESMLEVQTRILAHLARQRARHHGRCIVLITHAELIRCALLHYMGAPLDAWRGIEIGPACVSTLDIDDGGAQVVTLNERIPVSGIPILPRT